MSRSSFPSWLPAAVVTRAQEIQVEFASAEANPLREEIFRRLVTDKRMNTVWRELYKRKRVNHRSTDEFLHPAYLTHASIAAYNRQRAAELHKKGSAINESEAKVLEIEAAAYEGWMDPPTDARWSEQDRAAQLFFEGAYREALDIEPVFRSDLEAKVKELIELFQK